MPMFSSLRSWLRRRGPGRPHAGGGWASPRLEALEERAVPAGLVVSPEVNTGHMDGNQSETAIAVNPTNPNQLFVETNDNATPQGMYVSRSSDGGRTWTASVVAAGGADGLPQGFTDPSLQWDNFGNLFMSYINNSGTTFTVALSTDGGATFRVVGTIACQDQPHLAVGAGEVAAVCNNNSLQVSSARVSGLGIVGPFSTVMVPNSVNGNFGGIAIGPTGQIAVCFQHANSMVGPDTIMTSVDVTGVGGAFTAPIVAANVTVGGFRFIPAQSVRSIDAESKLAWDRSGGPHNGRLYLVYTDAPSTTSNDTNIFLRTSDNNGQTWSAARRVNDDNTANSQFFSYDSVDQTTGNLAISWYDCRNSPSNTQVEVFATASLDGGTTFLPNVRVATGLSDSTINHNGGNDYGDFMGLDFTHGSFFPCWVDNSRTLPGNTDLPNFDIATARVLIPAPPAPQPRLFYPLRYVFNPATGLYSGNLTLTNVGAGPLIGPVTLVFPKLPPGVTLVNPTGFTASGAPFIKVNFGVLFKNQSIAIPIVLSDPLNVPLSTFFIGFPVTLIFG